MQLHNHIPNLTYRSYPFLSGHACVCRRLTRFQYSLQSLSHRTHQFPALVALSPNSSTRTQTFVEQTLVKPNNQSVIDNLLPGPPCLSCTPRIRSFLPLNFRPLEGEMHTAAHTRRPL